MREYVAQIENLQAKLAAVSGDCEHNLKVYTKLQEENVKLKAAAHAFLSVSVISVPQWESAKALKRLL